MTPETGKKNEKASKRCGCWGGYGGYDLAGCGGFGDWNWGGCGGPLIGWGGYGGLGGYGGWGGFGPWGGCGGCPSFGSCGFGYGGGPSFAGPWTYFNEGCCKSNVGSKVSNADSAGDDKSTGKDAEPLSIKPAPAAAVSAAPAAAAHAPEQPASGPSSPQAAGKGKLSKRSGIGCGGFGGCGGCGGCGGFGGCGGCGGCGGFGGCGAFGGCGGPGFGYWGNGLLGHGFGGFPGAGWGYPNYGYGYGYPYWFARQKIPQKSKDVKPNTREEIPLAEDNSQRKKQTIHLGYGYASGDNYRLGYGMGGMGGKYLFQVTQLNVICISHLLVSSAGFI